jgi:hypothetical protein
VAQNYVHSAQNIGPTSRFGVKRQKAVSGYLVFSPKRDKNNDGSL